MKRRDFLTKSTFGLGMPALGLMGGNVQANQTLFDKILQYTDKANDHVLVLIQMVGGNDGLNTIFPMETYGNLWASRLPVVVRSEHILKSKLTDRVCFHPKIEGIRNLFDENKVKIVNSVGYPNQDFSHFRSMDIWMTGSDADKVISTGWVGRYLEKDFPNYPSEYLYKGEAVPPAIVTNVSSPVLMESKLGNLGVVVGDPAVNLQVAESKPSFIYKGNAKDQIDFLRISTALANNYTKEIYDRSIKVSRQKEYPNTYLGLQLKNIARMIASGVKTKVYLATISGFDTHANQVIKDTSHEGAHANLLAELSGAITAFMDDLKFLGISKRVVGATFSEFGRRVGSNGSFGTDHGAAAPLLVFGEQALGGIAGDNPTIDKFATHLTNIPMLYDFRSVFASIIKDWFCVSQNVLEDVFFKNFQYIPVVANFDCLGVTGNEQNNPDPINNYKPGDDPNSDGNINKITAAEKTINDGQRLKCYPNPFYDKLTIEFESTGGDTKVQIFNSLGQIIANVTQGTYTRGFYKIKIDTDYFADGLYYVRYQNKDFSKVANVVRMS